MSLQTDYDLSVDPQFRQRAAQGLVKSARDIINEPVDTVNHANRLAWAKTITGTNAAYAMVDQQAMMWIVANPTISTDYEEDPQQSVIDDNAILFTINSEVLPRLIPT